MVHICLPRPLFLYQKCHVGYKIWTLAKWQWTEQLTLLLPQHALSVYCRLIAAPNLTFTQKEISPKLLVKVLQFHKGILSILKFIHLFLLKLVCMYSLLKCTSLIYFIFPPAQINPFQTWFSTSVFHLSELIFHVSFIGKVPQS